MMINFFSNFGGSSNSPVYELKVKIFTDAQKKDPLPQDLADPLATQRAGAGPYCQ
jgi:hypothetical protein